MGVKTKKLFFSLKMDPQIGTDVRRWERRRGETAIHVLARTLSVEILPPICGLPNGEGFTQRSGTEWDGS
jgi:hypothetical protein